MDKLSESQRASIAKMSDERLQSKLSKAGYAREILTQFTRSDCDIFYGHEITTCF